MSRGRPALGVGVLGKRSYEEVPSGVRVTASTRDASGTVRKLRAVAGTREEADAALQRKANQLALTTDALSDATTFKNLLDAWFDSSVSIRNIRPQSKVMYRTKANKLAAKFGGILARDLDPARVQAMINILASENTAHEYSVLRGTLSQALRWAVVQKIIPLEPLMLTERPRLKKTPKPVSLTAHQLQVFRAAFQSFVEEGTRFSNRRNAQLAVDLILGLGGIRISEVLAIRWKDVDLVNGVVDVCGTLVYIPGQPVRRQDELKHADQERYVQLAPDGIAMRALRAAWDDAPWYRRRPEDPVIGRIEPDESAWVNPSIVSFHIDNVSWRPEVVSALADTGLTPEQLTPHTLRRTVATAVTRAADLDRAAELLGHASAKTTKRHYVTPITQTVDAADIDTLFDL